MRRKTNNLETQVYLFVGSCRIIILNKYRKIDYALRTVVLTEDTIYTHLQKQSEGSSSRFDSKNSIVQLQKLVSHEYEYKITIDMRPKLLLSGRDSDIQAYLKGLKTPQLILPQNESINIVAVTKKEVSGKIINGFILGSQKEAIEFYEAFNCAIGFQIYRQRSKEVTPFNYKLANLVGDMLNGQATIDPMDFGIEKQEEEELKLIGEIFDTLKNERLYDYKTDKFTLKLSFCLIDQKSLGYACMFVLPLAQRIHCLSLSHCQLSNYMLGQLVFSGSFKVINNLPQLQAINLSSNHLTDDAFVALGNLLSHSKQLYELLLSNNQISFEKSGVLESFLQSINKYKLKLDLSFCQIQNAQIILKYFINAEGDIPVEYLNVDGNPFKNDHLSALAKAYVQRKQNDPNFRLEVTISQIQFQDTSGFQLLTRQYRKSMPTAMAVPLAVSRHSSIRQSVPSNQEDEPHLAVIMEQMLRKYEAEVITGNFYARRKLRDELTKLGAVEELFNNEPVEIKLARQEQQKFIIHKLEKSINFDIEPSRVVHSLNEGIKVARRKGVVGRGVDVIAYTKWKLEQLLQEWSEQGKFNTVIKQIFSKAKKKYSAFYQQCKEEGRSSLNIDFSILAKQEQKQLMDAIKGEEENPNPELFLIYSYLSMEYSPENSNFVILDLLSSDPRLATAKMVRFDHIKSVKIKELERVPQRGSSPQKSLADIVANYDIVNYRFSQGFLQSGSSTSGYPGVLSNLSYDIDNLPTITSFIETCNNFMQILYYTPQQISEQTLLYVNTIADYLIDQNSQLDPDLKIVLTEELFLRMITYFDSERDKPLKRGILLSICEYLMRRVLVDQDLGFRVMAHLIKSQSFQLDQMHLLFGTSHSEGRIDWKVKDMTSVKELLLGKGRLKVTVVDISNQQLGVEMEVDQLSTVGEVWDEIKNNLNQLCPYSNIKFQQSECFWLFGTRNSGQSWQLRQLPSYEHIGKLIYEDFYEKKLFVRRIIYSPHYHSLSALKSLQYEQLLGIFQQARQSFRQSANTLLGSDPNNLKVKMTVESIWIDVLIEEQVVLASLRRNEGSINVQKYQDQRQKIINEYLAKIYIKYLPVGAVLTEQSRNAVVAELRSKKSECIPNVMSQFVRQKILNYYKTLGICVYTAKINDSTNQHLFFINNQGFTFQDKTTTPPRNIAVQFKSLVWFEFLAGEHSCMKFQSIQQKEGQQLRCKFVIEGENTWLVQCYSMILNVCKVRLSYPAQLLFSCEDSHSGMSEIQFSDKIAERVGWSVLEIDKFFSFTIPRIQKRQLEETNKKKNGFINQSIQKSKSDLKEKKEDKAAEKSIENNQEQIIPQKQPNQPESEKINQQQQPSENPMPPKKLNPSRVDLPFPSIPERQSESTVRRPSDMEIEDILKGPTEGDQKQNQVLHSKRNSGKNTSIRRRSRNR